jgi:hypothetical protein
MLKCHIETFTGIFRKRKIEGGSNIKNGGKNIGKKKRIVLDRSRDTKNNEINEKK